MIPFQYPFARLSTARVFQRDAEADVVVETEFIVRRWRRRNAPARYRGTWRMIVVIAQKKYRRVRLLGCELQPTARGQIHRFGTIADHRGDAAQPQTFFHRP